MNDGCNCLWYSKRPWGKRAEKGRKGGCLIYPKVEGLEPSVGMPKAKVRLSFLGSTKEPRVSVAD